MPGAPYPLDHSKTHDLKTPQRAIGNSRFSQESEEERSFLSMPVSRLKLRQKMWYAYNLWKDCSWSKCQAAFGYLCSPGHPWRLTVRWIICLKSKGIVRKSDRLGGFLFEWSSSKRDTILDSREDHPLNWNHWPLWLLSMKGKSKNVTDFVTKNTGTSLERCSFQSQFLKSWFSHLQRESEINAKSNELLIR